MGMQRKVRSETKRDSAQPGDTGKNMLEGRECTEIIESDQFVTFVKGRWAKTLPSVLPMVGIWGVVRTRQTPFFFFLLLAVRLKG